MVSWINIACLILLYFIGLAIVIVPFVIEDRRTTELGARVQAQVVGSKKIKPKKAVPGETQSVYTIWLYKYNGTAYYHKVKHKGSAGKKQGTVATFTVNREKPSKVYRLMNRKEKIIFRASGFSLMVLPAVCLCIMTMTK